MNLIRQLNKVTLNVYLPSHSCVMWCFIRQLFIIYWMLVKSAKCKHNNSKIMSAGPKKHSDMGHENHYSQHNNPAYEIRKLHKR